MANDARTRFTPIVPASAREIVPMERFVVEVAGGPLRHPGKHILLRDQSPARAPANCGSGNSYAKSKSERIPTMKTRLRLCATP